MKFNFIKKDKHLIIGYWVVIYSIFWLQALPQTLSFWEATLAIALFIISISPYCNYLSGPLLERAIKSKNYKKFIFQFVLFSLIVGINFILVASLFHYLEQQHVFPESFYFNLDYRELGYITVFYSAGTIINISLCGLRFFVVSMKNQKKTTEYQLRTLQHQVTPHFMFNVLNHIHILMQDNVDLASDLLLKYSDILRYQLYNGDKEMVTIEQDIQFLKDFISVEEIRWQDKLSVTCNWEIDDPRREIPALLFITFIENAFKYVSKLDFERGYILINLELKDNTIKLLVENSKSALASKEKNEGGLGLKNIRERLEILYFGRYELSINETDSRYNTKLIINI